MAHITDGFVKRCTSLDGAMGVYIDYAFQIECSEEELLERLRRLRRRLRGLPFDSVSRVLRVNPAYQPLQLQLLPDHGFSLPPPVKRRLAGKLGTRHDELCHLAAPPVSCSFRTNSWTSSTSRQWS